MKKLLFCAIIFLFSVASHAQFEKNKWVVSPSITQLNVSYSGYEKTTVGFEAEGGLFIMDNVAVLLNGGTNIREGGDDKTSLGAGVRYYFENVGIYVGTKARFDQYDFQTGNKKDVSLGGEVGYAFFLTRNLTVEPAIYYNQSLTDQHYSKVGLKLGFGFYF